MNTRDFLSGTVEIEADLYCSPYLYRVSEREIREALPTNLDVSKVPHALLKDLDCRNLKWEEIELSCRPTSSGMSFEVYARTILPLKIRHEEIGGESVLKFEEALQEALRDNIEQFRVRFPRVKTRYSGNAKLSAKALQDGVAVEMRVPRCHLRYVDSYDHLSERISRLTYGEQIDLPCLPASVQEFFEPPMKSWEWSDPDVVFDEEDYSTIAYSISVETILPLQKALTEPDVTDLLEALRDFFRQIQKAFGDPPSHDGAVGYLRVEIAQQWQGSNSPGTTYSVRRQRLTRVP